VFFDYAYFVDSIATFAEMNIAMATAAGWDITFEDDEGNVTASDALRDRGLERFDFPLLSWWWYIRPDSDLWDRYQRLLADGKICTFDVTTGRKWNPNLIPVRCSKGCEYVLNVSAALLSNLPPCQFCESKLVRSDIPRQPGDKGGTIRVLRSVSPAEVLTGLFELTSNENPVLGNGGQLAQKLGGEFTVRDITKVLKDCGFKPKHPRGPDGRQYETYVLHREELQAKWAELIG
jgi:hypothetical protein